MLEKVVELEDREVVRLGSSVEHQMLWPLLRVVEVAAVARKWTLRVVMLGHHFLLEAQEAIHLVVVVLQME